MDEIVMDSTIHQQIIGLVIFYTCAGVFVATALAVVLDLFNQFKLQKDVRKKLHKVMLVEIIVIGIGTFSNLLNFDISSTVKQVKESENAATTLLEEVQSTTVVKEPSNLSQIVAALDRGTRVKVIFDGKDCKDDRTYRGSKVDPIGSLLCGQTYLVQYLASNNSWTTTGYNEGTRSILTTSYKGQAPSNERLNLWGLEFPVDENGFVTNDELGAIGRVVL